MGQCAQSSAETQKEVTKVDDESLRSMISRSQSADHEKHEYGPELVNQMLTYMWPAIEEFAETIIKGNIEPALKGALGESFGFEYDHFNLGRRPLTLDKLETDEHKGIPENSETDIVVKADINWEGDVAVLTRFKGFKFGITKLNICGSAICEAVGMLPRPPFFRGARVFFLTPPEIDLAFQGAMAGVIEKFGTVKELILDVVSDQVSAKFVVPNHLTIQLDPDSDYFDIKNLWPQGILTINVLSAKDIVAKDWNVLSKSTSDPYVVVNCGAEKHQSPSIKKTLNPTFNFKSAFQIFNAKHQTVHIQLWDHDLTSQDDHLGEIALDVQSMIAWGENNQNEYSLKDDKGNDGGFGTVLLTATWQPLFLLDSNGSNLDGPGVVLLSVYSATSVPCEDEDTKFQLYGRCRSPFEKGAEEQTSYKVKFNSPEVSNKGAEVQKMKNKFECLKKYKVNAEDMAEVLGVKTDKIKEIIKKKKNQLDDSVFAELIKAPTDKLMFNYPFNFIVENLTNEVITIELKSQSPDSQEKSLGTHNFRVSELRAAECGTRMSTVKLEGTDVSLQVKFQCRPMGKPSQQVP